MRRLLVLLGCAAVLAGCGDDDKKAADDARYRAEQAAIVELATMQSLLADAEKAYAAGDAERAVDVLDETVTEHYAARVAEPLAAADADLEASLAADLGERLRGLLAAGAPAAEVRRLFAQIQTDLITAYDAIRS